MVGGTIVDNSLITATRTLSLSNDEMRCKTTIYFRSRILPTYLRDLILWTNGVWEQIRRRFSARLEQPTTAVDIETTTYCNRRCSYCPNSVFERGLKKNERRMPVSLFESIIDQLAEMNFSGRISPHLFGEPLADPRLVSLMKYAHTKLPRAILVVYTNGDFLTPVLLSQLWEVGVRNYEITLHKAEVRSDKRSLERIDQLMRDTRRDKKYVNLIIRHSSEMILWNRGGLLDIDQEPPPPRCLHSDSPIAINYRGDVVICCNDYLGEVTFGNLQNESLRDVWTKPEFVTLRQQLKQKVYALDICKRCTGALPRQDS